MNPILDPLPEAITVSGRDFSLYTDFRASIRFELMLLDPKISPEKQALEALRIYMPYLKLDTSAPDDATLYIARHAAETVEQLCRFYTGADRPGRYGGKAAGRTPRLYDYEYDAAALCASFLAAYGIDLHKARLHWWSFHDLFLSLPDDTAIRRIMRIRAAKCDGKTPPAERKRIAALQRLYALPDRAAAADRTRISRVEEILLGDGDLRRLEADQD